MKTFYWLLLKQRNMLGEIFQSNRCLCQLHTSSAIMGKVNRSISPKVPSKKKHSLEKLEKNVFKAGQKKPGPPTAKKTLPIVSKRKAQIPSGKITMANKKKKAISSSSKPQDVLLHPSIILNLALPPTCSFLVQTPSSDPSVACFEGPGVSIKMPIKQDSTATGQTIKAKKEAPKMNKAQKK